MFFFCFCYYINFLRYIIDYYLKKERRETENQASKRITKWNDIKGYGLLASIQIFACLCMFFYKILPIFPNIPNIIVIIDSCLWVFSLWIFVFIVVLVDILSLCLFLFVCSWLHSPNTTSSLYNSFAFASRFISLIKKLNCMIAYFITSFDWICELDSFAHKKFFFLLAVMYLYRCVLCLNEVCRLEFGVHIHTYRDEWMDGYVPTMCSGIYISEILNWIYERKQCIWSDGISS